MKLHIYIASQLGMAVALAVAGMFFVALPGIAVAAVHRLAGASFIVFFRYLPLTVTELLPYILPMSYLLAVVAVFGRLAADNEWTAIRMSGRHPLSTFLTPAIAAVGLGIFTWWLVAVPGPMLNREQRAYLVSAVPNVVRNLSPGRTELQLGPFYLSSRFRAGNAFLDAYVYLPETDGEGPRELRARRVEIGFDQDLMKVKLHDWRTVLEPLSIESEVGLFLIQLDHLFEQKITSFGRPRYQTSSMLEDALASGELDEKKRREAIFVLHQRYALGTTFLLFLLLGAPTGLILRRGTQLGALAVAVGYATLYYILDLRMGTALGTEGVLPPRIAAWMTTGIGTVAGGVLAFRALRE